MIQPDNQRSSAAVVIPPESPPTKRQKLCAPDSAVLALLSLSKASAAGLEEERASQRTRRTNSSSSSSFAISLQINGQAPKVVKAERVVVANHNGNNDYVNHVSDDDDEMSLRGGCAPIVPSSSSSLDAITRKRRVPPLLSKPRFPSTAEQSRLLYGGNKVIGSEEKSMIPSTITTITSSSIVYPTSVPSSNSSMAIETINKTTTVEMPAFPSLPVGKPLGLPLALPSIPCGATFGGSTFLSTELSTRG